MSVHSSTSSNRERCSAAEITVAHLLEFDFVKFSEIPPLHIDSF
jgi:hypothetical protein